MKYEQAEHCYPHPPIPTVVEAYENAFPAPERIAARTSTGLKNMAAFFVSRAERTNDVCLCAYKVADILKEAADAINKLETERDETGKLLRIAVGMLSATPQFQGQHPEQVLKFIEEATK